MRALLPIVLCGAVCGVLCGVAQAETCDDAEHLLDQAQMTLDPGERFRLADRAQALCEKASVATPVDVEATFRIVRALTMPDAANPEACRSGRCEDALRRLEKLAKRPDAAPDAARIASEQGIVLSRMQRYAEALSAYERALPLIDATRIPFTLDERQGSVLLWGNSAETAMALGRLDEAIRRYQLAVDAATYGSAEWQLALYGLGVALDRDGQGELAKRTIGKALERDPALARLHDDSVFFEPPGDVAYYEGLAHEVAGDRQVAKEAFERFLAAQPGSPHVARARWHIAQLGQPAPAPKPHVEIGQPLVMKGRRTAESIRGRVAVHLGDLATCYARVLRAQPGVSVSFQLALELSPLGFVTQRAHVLSSDQSLELARCVELSAESWRFAPVQGGDVEAALIPLDFSPR
ncbi:MAG: tetratricopeptide repeat protein [Polyangia bacterium]